MKLEPYRREGTHRDDLELENTVGGSSKTTVGPVNQHPQKG